MLPTRKNWFQRHLLLSILGGCFILFLLLACFVAGVLGIVEYSFKNSGAYTQALAQARNNSQVVEKFGQPVQPGWFGSGSINVSGPSGNADISIPISGPKAKGTIYVIAKKSAGKWHFETLEVEVEGEPDRINLLSPPVPIS